MRELPVTASLKSVASIIIGLRSELLEMDGGRTEVGWGEKKLWLLLLIVFYLCRCYSRVPTFKLYVTAGDS